MPPGIPRDETMLSNAPALQAASQPEKCLQYAFSGHVSIEMEHSLLILILYEMLSTFTDTQLNSEYVLDHSLVFMGNLHLSNPIRLRSIHSQTSRFSFLYFQTAFR
jgi:hypothetical protein